MLYLCLRQGGKATLLDGSKRKAEHTRRGLKTSIPTTTAHSHLEVLKVLIHNGHHARAATHAATYAPEYTHKVSTSLTQVMGMSREKLKPYLHALRSPSERHKLPRRAIKVVTRARKLYEHAMLGKQISIDDLGEVLGPFLED